MAGPPLSRSATCSPSRSAKLPLGQEIVLGSTASAESSRGENVTDVSLMPSGPVTFSFRSCGNPSTRGLLVDLTAWSHFTQAIQRVHREPGNTTDGIRTENSDRGCDADLDEAASIAKLAAPDRSCDFVYSYRAKRRTVADDDRRACT